MSWWLPWVRRVKPPPPSLPGNPEVPAAGDPVASRSVSDTGDPPRGAGEAWLRARGLLDEHVDILIENRLFMFAANFRRGTHEALAAEVRRCGGRVTHDPDAAPEVDYLVLGENPVYGWNGAKRPRNRKLRLAVRARLGSGVPHPRIVTETQFRLALKAARARWRDRLRDQPPPP